MSEILQKVNDDTPSVKKNFKKTEKFIKDFDECLARIGCLSEDDAKCVLYAESYLAQSLISDRAIDPTKLALYLLIESKQKDILLGLLSVLGTKHC